MATTRIIPMHINKGKTIAQCLTDRTAYAQNPDKTSDGELISAYECDPKTADAEFLLSKQEYRRITGRDQKHDVIAYQFRQSFKPGEVTAEEANQIGYEFAKRFLKGKHAFLVATHIDHAHIHNHIIWNSTTLDCRNKFRDFKRSGMAARKLSDLICLEHGLSIVEQPNRHGSAYNKWLGEQGKTSHRELLRIAIDQALEKQPVSFEELLQLLREAGWEIKNGKELSFRSEGQKRFVRLATLGEDYTRNEIIAVLAGTKEHTPRKRRTVAAEGRKVSLLVDIQAKLQAGKGIGYERWAKVFNLKQMARTMNYLSEQNLLDYTNLEAKVAAATHRYKEISSQIKLAEQRMAEIAVLKMQIINYSKTRQTYIDYRKSGYSRRFYVEHESELIVHKAAKKAFDDLGVERIPKIKDLQSEYVSLLHSKKQAYGELRNAREKMRELLTVKDNVDRIMGYESNAKQEKEHDQKDHAQSI